MKRKKISWDPLLLRTVSFSIPIEDFLKLNQQAVRTGVTIADLLRKKLGYPTKNDLKIKRLKRNNPYFNN
jgi:hypothetical protein